MSDTRPTSAVPEEKRALLARLLQQRASRSRHHPLSFAQERLWFLGQMQPEGVEYHVPSALILRGRLDVDAMERALREILRRQDSLRTRIELVDGVPMQIVDPHDPSWTLPAEDLSGLDPGEREEAARKLRAAEAKRPFSLADGPLIRIRLLRMEEDHHALLLTSHHIIGDGWSQGVLLREIAALYGAFAAGEESPLPPLTLQYADFAGWQRRYLRGETLDAQLEYWRRHLEGAPGVLELPLDRPRPPVLGTAGAYHSFMLPAEVEAGLAALARREGATPFMVYLAAFQLLLARWAGEERVVVGTPVAGRTRAEVEPLIGLFVNTLALHTDLSGDPSFRELLARVRETALGAFAHQAVPFEMVVEAVQPERSLSHAPVFQVMFAYQNTPGQHPEIPGLETEHMGVAIGTSQFDLNLSVHVLRDGLAVGIDYSTAIFERGTMERMGRHYLAILEAAVAAPELPVSRIDLASPAERRQALVEWNETGSSYPDVPIHHLVAERARSAPGAVAVVHGGESLTYADLDTRANRLAHALRARGARTDTPVAVHLERGIDLVVALLAVMKSGAPYLPLDPSNPSERLSWMLEDSGASILVTTASLSASSAPPRETRSSSAPLRSVSAPLRDPSTLRLDADAAEIAQHPPTAPDVVVDPANLAYVVYTSGSTGTPKGVGVPHRGLANLAAWHGSAFAIGSADRVSQVAAPGFDAFGWEVWPALAAGAALDLVPDEVRLDPVALRDWLVDREVTVAFLPTPLAEAVLGLEWPTDAKLRFLLAGGDRLHAHPAPGLPFALVNAYGPTECSVVATAGRVEPGAADAMAPSIGRPVANARAYVLDGHGASAPVGVAGELYVGGDGVARGYLRRPALTAERFVPDPFSSEPGRRLYRTGDRVRWRPAGELEFLGRTDQQVKVRGFRIEPGEIEAALRALDAVAEAVVVARGERDDRRLVAYVVAEEGAEGDVDAEALRDALRSTLPEHMVPSAFVTLDRLPLTANGKVDHRALPPPGAGDPGDAAEHVAPRTPVEAAVAEIWGEVLGVERVGVHDDFFRLGGHSLRITQVVSRVRQRLSVELPLRAFFESPTVAGLAARIEREARPTGAGEGRIARATRTTRRLAPAEGR